MAQTQVVYNNVADDASLPPGQLFAGLKFCVAQRVPTRSTFVNQIRANGGQIVVLENIADIFIADHMKKDSPPGSTSYTWLETSIRNGELANREEHRAGPVFGISRPVGSARPAKTGGRNPYTHEDDLFLYDWVEKYRREGKREANYWKGNEIYKQLELVNNRHPWQSWRDRYIKYVSVKPPIERQNGEAHESLPAPPATQIPTTAEISGLDGANQIPSTAPPAARTMQQRRAQDQEMGNEGIGKTQDRPSTDSPSPVAKTTLEAQETRAEPLTETLQRSSGVIQTPKHAVENPPTSHTPNSLRKRPSTPLQGQRSTPIRQQSHAEIHSGKNTAQDPEDVDDFDFSAFTEEDKKFLLDEAEDIQQIAVGVYEGTWDALAKFKSTHSAKQWRDYYEVVVLPLYRVIHQQEGEGADDTGALERDDNLMPTNIRPSDRRKSFISPPTKRKRNVGEGVSANDTTDDPEPSNKRKRELTQTIMSETESTVVHNSTSSRVLPSGPFEIASHKSQAINIESDDNVEEDDMERSSASDLVAEGGKIEREVEVYECDVIEENDQENLGTRPPAAINNHRNTEQSLRAFSKEPTDFVLQANDSESSSDEEIRESELESSSEASEKEYLDATQHPVEIEDNDDDDDYDDNERYDESMAATKEYEDLFLPQEEKTTTYPLADVRLSGANANDAIIGMERERSGEVEEHQTSSHTQVHQHEGGFEGSDPIEIDLTIAIPPDIEEAEPEPQFEDSHNELLDTQAFLRSDTPVLDLGLPLPPNDEEILHQSQTRSNHDIEFDTQGFLNSDTQKPDLGIPDPPNMDDASEQDVEDEIRTVSQEIRSSPPPMPDSAGNSQSAESEPTNLCTEHDLDEFISYHTNRGHKVDDIMYALDRTTMHASLAEKVLEALHEGVALPKLPGIWTEEDDEILRESTEVGLEKLRRYHGDSALRTRQGSDVWSL